MSDKGLTPNERKALEESKKRHAGALRRLTWAKDDFTMREADSEPTPEQIKRAQEILDKAIEECIPKKVIWDPPV